jgi:hypothetical protein
MATTTEVDLTEYTVAELKDMAEEQGISIPSHATKDEIIKAIEKGGGDNPGPEQQAEVTPFALPAGAINTIPLSDITSDLYGIGKRYNITSADIVGLGAATTGSLLLDNLPAGSLIQYVRIKNTVAVTGVTTCPVQVYDGTSATNTYGTAFDVCTPVSATNLMTAQPAVPATVPNFATTTPIYLGFNGSTGGNLSAVTGGAVSVWVRYVIIE